MTTKPTYQDLEKEIEILRTEKAKSEKEKKILNSITDGVYINSADYNIEYVNEPMIKMLGGDKTGQKCYKAIYNKDKICEWCVFKKLKKDNTITHELKHPVSNNFYSIKNTLHYNGSKISIYYDISELKRIDKQKTNELEKQSLFINTLLDNLKVGIVACDADGKLTYFNKTTQKLHGLPQKEIDSEHWAEYYDLYFPDGKTKMQTKDIPLFKALEGEQFNDIEMMIIPKQGKSYTLAASGSTILDANGKNQGAVVSMYDISERIKAEQALKESEEKYRLITENASDVIWILNVSQNKFTYTSPSEEKISGYTSKESVQQSIKEKFTTESAKRAEEIIKTDTQKFIKNQKNNSIQVHQFQQKCKDGGLVWIETSTSFRYNSAKEIEIVGITRNIDDRKKVEQELIENKELIDIALKGYKAGTYKWKMIDNSAYLSTHWKQMVGIKPDKILPNKLEVWANRVHPDDIQEVMDLVANTVKEHKPFVETIHRLKHEEGHWIWILGRGHIEYSDEGAPVQMTGIHTNITERILQEETIKSQNLELKQINATKDKFFNIIAHDLKSPFTAILGFSNILLKNHKKYDIEKREKMINSVNKSAINAFKLLENLLTWSRSQSGELTYLPEKLHLKILLFETMGGLQGQADKKNIHVLDDLSESELVYADKNMIATVFRNLISNAIKFTNTGGGVIISSKKLADDNFLEISIEDTGIGIPEDTVVNLFHIDKSISTEGTEKETGTGLGLILCKEFVEKHGGKIWVEIEERKGSTFYFTIPMSR